MTSIIINNLELFSFIGVHKEEKILGQKFVCCAEIFVDFSKINDNIEETISYSNAMKMINKKAENCKYNLIETFANEIVNEILKYKNVTRVIVEIKKPNAPMKLNFNYVSVKVDKKN
jgi:dihydroneopterin aldolase